MKKDVIKDCWTGEIYFDTGIIRNFEQVLEKNVTLEKAKKKYPNIVVVDD